MIHKNKDCGHTGCKPWPKEPDLSKCKCKGFSHYCIPNGKHIHIDCPIHGHVILRGPNVSMCA